MRPQINGKRSEKETHSASLEMDFSKVCLELSLPIESIANIDKDLVVWFTSSATKRRREFELKWMMTKLAVFWCCWWWLWNASSSLEVAKCFLGLRTEDLQGQPWFWVRNSHVCRHHFPRGASIKVPFSQFDPRPPRCSTKYPSARDQEWKLSAQKMHIWVHVWLTLDLENVKSQNSFSLG